MGFGDLLKKAKEKAGELSTAAGNLSSEINDKLQQSREEAIKREAEQKRLSKEDRIKSAADTYAVRSTADCCGKRYILCDP